MRIEAFILHLARAEQRRPQVERLAQTLPMPVHVVEAVDGRRLGDSEVGSLCRPAIHWPRYPFAPGRGEIGCFLSHRKAWREIVDRGLDFGLVLEDDVEIDISALNGLIAFLETVARPADFIRLPQDGRSEAGPVVAAQGRFSVTQPSTPAFGAVLQIVGRDAAQRLLDLTETFDRPVDAVLQMRWLHGLRVLSARPVIVREISRSLGGSLAQARGKSLGGAVRREILRPLYRLAVRLRNRMHGR